MLQKIWTSLNSPFGLLVLGFALTTVIGTVLTDWVQRRAWNYQSKLEQQRQDFEWKRSRKFELLRRKLDEGQTSLEQISALVNLRFFRLHKVYEALLSGDLKTANRLWKEYMETVEKWNVKLIINQNKLERLVNTKVAWQFNNYETDNPELRDPTSVHGRFFLAHKHVLAVLDCRRKDSCSVTKEMRRGANERLRSLDYATDSFVDEVSTLFLERTFDLEEFRDLDFASEPLRSSH